MSVIAFVIAGKEPTNIVSTLLLINKRVLIAGIAAVSAELRTASLVLTIKLGVTPAVPAVLRVFKIEWFLQLWAIRKG